jgi:hypothetical protein
MSAFTKIASAILTLLLLFLIGMLLAAACYTTRGANVVYNVRDFTTSTNLRRAQITPLSTPAVIGTNIIQSDRLTFTNITDGSFTVTNMVGELTYRVELFGPFTTTTFTNLIPDTTDTIYAKDYVTNFVSAGVTVGYSQAAANLRFVLVTNGGSVNQSVTNALTVYGSATVATNLTVTNGLTVVGIQTNNTDVKVAGNVIVTTAGKGIQIKEGSNARLGTLTLTNGTGTVANTSVTASSRIFLQLVNPNGSATASVDRKYSISAGASFTVTGVSGDGSTNSDDISTVNWLIVEPSP